MTFPSAVFAGVARWHRQWGGRCAGCGRTLGSATLAAGRAWCSPCRERWGGVPGWWDPAPGGLPGWAAAPYTPVTRRAVLVAKRGHAAGLAELVAARMPEALLPPGAVVSWIPGHPRRTVRAPDSGEQLARAVAREAGLAACPLLWRRLGAARQSGASADERHAAAGALGLTVRGRRSPPLVVLVDDVRTTGATLDEAAGQLRAAGARHVLGLVACQAGPPS